MKQNQNDFFKRPENRPAPKIEGRGVPWKYKTYSQCQQEGLLGELAQHIRTLEPDKAAGYAKYLIQNAEFPKSFFEKTLNVKVESE